MSSADPSPHRQGPQSSRPLLAGTSPQCVVAWRGSRAVTVADFLAAVTALAAHLPVAPAAVNLCEDRYAFMVAFAALLARGQSNLLPPSRAPHAVDTALGAYPEGYSLGDVVLYPTPPRYLRFRPDAPGSAHEIPAIAPDGIAVVGYTSGSTGVSCPHPKRWRELSIATGHSDRLLYRLAGGAYHVVATVPPQHMYGLELSVVLPLVGRATVHAGRPLYPADIAQALRDVPAPRVLVTTPVHLRTLVMAGQPLPPLAAIVSATAPLTVELATTAERQFDAPVQELFGATETCVIAHRRTAQEQAWTPYRGVALQPQPDGTRVEAPQLLQAVLLPDIIEQDAAGHFRLRGRNADLLEIAGKRASLSDLSHKLLAVPGVRDGVIFQLEDADTTGVRRVAALVVAPGVTTATILAALRAEIDPAFLPRPLKKVDALPRGETGKLPRAALLEMLRRDQGPGTGDR